MESSDEPTRTICRRCGHERPLAGECSHCTDVVIEEPQESRGERGRLEGYFCRLWAAAGPQGSLSPVDITTVVPTAEAARFEARRRLAAFVRWRARRAGLPPG